MKYIPILTFISDTDAAFQIHIIDKNLEKEVGIGSIILKKECETFNTVQCEYYVPEQYNVSKKEIEAECLKTLIAMKKVAV